MKVLIRGTNKNVNLTDKNWLAAGGEGEIYFKGDLVYKICDNKHMIPEGKITELSVLKSNPLIICPEDLLVDSKDQIVGYTMKYVKTSYTLSRLMTKTFRLNKNILQDDIWKIVTQMQNNIQFVHQNDILLVDLNELNFLIDDKFENVYFIDVNSYQTKNYPAQAIMDSIRDFHTNTLTKLTDWFSFAVLSFRMVVGIHPYGGNHPSFGKRDLKARMMANVTVMDNDVTYPQGSCFPISDIPKHYLDWYKAVLCEGKRVEPPFGISLINVPTNLQIVHKLVVSKQFKCKEAFDYENEIVKVYFAGMHEIVITTQNIFINRKKQNVKLNTHSGLFVGFSPKYLRPIIVFKDAHNKLKLFDLISHTELKYDLEVNEIMECDGRLYLITQSQVLELHFRELSETNIIVTSTKVTNIVPEVTTVFDGVIFQNLFEAYHVSIFPSSGVSIQIPINDLKGYKLIDAKYSQGVLMVLAYHMRENRYDRLIFWLDNSKTKMNHCVTENVTLGSLNFTVCDNGNCISIYEDEKITLFRSSNPMKQTEISDNMLSSDMILYSRGAEVFFTRGGKMYSFATA